MLRIRCPHCGERDEIEFRYRGDATRVRPAADAGLGAFNAYVFERDNPRGWHLEWWLHAGGCRKLLKVARHTVTHEIAAVGEAHEDVRLPREMMVAGRAELTGDSAVTAGAAIAGDSAVAGGAAHDVGDALNEGAQI